MTLISGPQTQDILSFVHLVGPVAPDFEDFIVVHVFSPDRNHVDPLYTRHVLANAITSYAHDPSSILPISAANVPKISLTKLVTSLNDIPVAQWLPRGTEIRLTRMQPDTKWPSDAFLMDYIAPVDAPDLLHDLYTQNSSEIIPESTFFNVAHLVGPLVGILDGYAVVDVVSTNPDHTDIVFTRQMLSASVHRSLQETSHEFYDAAISMASSITLNDLVTLPAPNGLTQWLPDTTRVSFAHVNPSLLWSPDDSIVF